MPGKRILLVEDEIDVAQYVQTVLDLDDHAIDISIDPLIALKRYQPGAYDLVVTDNQMNMISGLELATRIKAISPSQPVLLLTGYPPLDREPVVDLIMLKPFSADELRRAVASLTRNTTTAD